MLTNATFTISGAKLTEILADLFGTPSTAIVEAGTDANDEVIELRVTFPADLKTANKINAKLKRAGIIAD